MRIAVLSDIHSNLAAFEAVQTHWESLRPDAVLVGGDVINRGPQPRECLEIILKRVREDGWRIIRGNHEDYVLRAARGVDDLKDWEKKIFAHTTWTEPRVRDYLDVIRSWPDETEISAPDGARVICTHASRKGNRVGLYEFMNEDELIDHAHPHADVLCVGHTHVPFIRAIHHRWIVNAGSVGMPFDGDPRAAYALLEWSPGGWTMEIMRVPYDRAITEAAYHTSGYLYGGGPLAPVILWELQNARARVGYWHRQYEEQVAAGTISIEDSVQLVLNEES